MLFELELDEPLDELLLGVLLEDEPLFELLEELPCSELPLPDGWPSF